MRVAAKWLVAWCVGMTIQATPRFVPQVADGPRIQTSLVIFETGGRPIDVRIVLTDAAGDAMSMDFGPDGTASEFNLSLAPRAVRILRSVGSGPGSPGAARIESSAEFGSAAILTLVGSSAEFLAETGIPGVIPAGSMVLPVDFDSEVNTGVALHNTAPGLARVRFRLFDQSGEPGPDLDAEIPPHGHRAGFVGGADGLWKDLGSFRGSLRIDSNQPLAVCALRQHRIRLNLTAFPVEPTTAGRKNHFVAQVGVGSYPEGFLKTGFILTNLSDRAGEAFLVLTGAAGEPLPITMEGRTDIAFPLPLPPHGTRFLEADLPGGGTAGQLQVGGAAITADVAINATGIFTLLDPSGRFRTETAVGSGEPMVRAVFPLLDEAEISTGAEYLNPGAETLALEIEPHGSESAPFHPPSLLELPARGHRSEFVRERFGTVPPGTLTAFGSSEVAMMGIRMRREPLWYTILPFARETSPQWRSLNPGHGGQVQHVSADPNVTGRLYLASDMEGFYATDDFGASWRYLGWNTPSGNILRVEAEPGNSGRLYVGFAGPEGGGLAISDDDGKRFAVAELGNRTSMGTIAIDPADPSTVPARSGTRCLPTPTARWTSGSF